MFRKTTALAAALTLTACTQFPALDRAVPAEEQTGPYPRLAPIGALVAQTEDPRIAPGDEAALAARRAALRARADRLRRD
ncbi:hypothetical protein OB2597_00935 [Pseudooceanicola batsensis HTCC2597]|uniref:Uncharacterized protein n=1 Tax=Pseudooceanicola batsensis (strain ATCC BAA-863 / DSM 15984 / KCTC 12145 / HTCC2597) TaxID=252305 RepID=A3U204_PSEBH|nr:hypothetical protein [Pseudooceanicola batsensis]EAQ01938.1 hypothetical protein OB2597_00935 [Pseudooceanicola batsensis HTCC2597]